MIHILLLSIQDSCFLCFCSPYIFPTKYNFTCRSSSIICTWKHIPKPAIPWGSFILAFLMNQDNNSFIFTAAWIGLRSLLIPVTKSTQCVHVICHLSLVTSSWGLGAWELAREYTGTVTTPIAINKRNPFVPDPGISWLLLASKNERQINELAFK